MKWLGVLLIAALAGVQANATTYDWLVMYYMPYDNDLSPLSTSITRNFIQSRINTKTVVTLQTDLQGDGGMMRYSFDASIDSVRIMEENSSSARTFQDYLTWAAANFKAKHYAIVLLNHGGALNEYGLDEFPERRWIQIDSLSEAIRIFNNQTGIGKIDLLFQQVCTRGIENFFEFRDVAEYTFASQDLVPAPGYYYPNVFSALDATNIKSGAQLAELIVRSEQDDMYYSYTLIDNAKWSKWGKLFDRYVKSLQGTELEIYSDSLKFISYSGQMYYDLVSVSNAIIKVGDQSVKNEFQQYTTKVLIKNLYRSTKTNRLEGYCGVSICSPFKPVIEPLDCYTLPSYLDYVRTLHAAVSARRTKSNQSKKSSEKP